MATNVSTDSESVEAFVNLQIGDRTFRVEKAILMNKMKYFEAMFTTEMIEKNQTTIVLSPETVLIVKPEVFSTILDFINNPVDFTKVDIRSLYRAADYLHFEELNRRIEAFMKSDMKSSNVILYKEIAVEFNLKMLSKLCYKFVINSMNLNINRGQLIPLLHYDELVDILDKLRSLSREEEMFHYVVEWVSDLETDRKGELLELLKNIPLQALSLTFLNEEGSKVDLIKNDSECANLLLEAVNKPRLDRLYVVGGTDGQALSSISEYTNGQWSATTPMPSPLSHLNCVVVGHKIYIWGGWDRWSSRMDELNMFDTITRTWTELTPMKQNRENCGMAVLNGDIYVSGGFDGYQHLATVERYSLHTDQWSEVAPMSIERSGLELVALNGFLYAIGGTDSEYRSVKSVEQYDPETDQWSEIGETNNKYNYFGSAVLNGHIYIAGDNTCEVYDSADDTWTEMPAPSEGYVGRRLEAYDGKLYAIGGSAEGVIRWKGSKTVEVFDFQARVWRSEPDMDVARCCHGVAVVKH